ncbi:hypothetical protein GWK48_07200 [Metallosphaera tengchongensis]|uniref:Uncharacterized protein n=1 Tax=Metallosphaera tengchongensis TaxID=1532350 RepID=A0A6N0NXT5_9CREN|nr:hypothetical protein [Metallosphaera tengchongensis]QKR00188.1 hypothetical protein GWK48_07200 [Metallosphaera tengchongensis]
MEQGLAHGIMTRKISLLHLEKLRNMLGDSNQDLNLIWKQENLQLIWLSGMAKKVVSEALTRFSYNIKPLANQLKKDLGIETDDVEFLKKPTFLH